jgi:ribosome-binding protein aMBF1 (putative translation factor)
MTSSQKHCEICGTLIDPERVEAVPETRLCVEHAREIGKYGGEFKNTLRQSSLGKAGSLKKNYGDVSVSRRRNTDALHKLREQHKNKAE